MAKESKQRIIYVYAHWAGIDEPALMGMLYSELLRGKEVFSFEYEDKWLHSKYAMQLDPDLSLYPGKHYLTDNKPNFGLFLDSSPDRWGQVLMRRREAALARTEERREQNLYQTDYLLGVYDGHRMGGLRFKLDPDGPFLNDNRDIATPPWTSIRELEQVSLQLEDEDAADDPEYLKWLAMLIAPGSSLGGARPKASVSDPDGNLWIAKFPSKNDGYDHGAWEMVIHELAKAAGIGMAESQARKFSSKYHTFLTKRFDRTPQGERIHFASAMTLLGYSDGQNYQDGISYLELVNFITSQGGNPNPDLEELWRRIVFSICVSNTDDHLRNHGFILTESGWVLSPAYDINPNETGTGLSLNISENDNALSLELAMEVHDYFRLSKQRAGAIIEEVRQAVSNWRVCAKGLGISNTEQEEKARAFQRAK
jgi:serine/threonine-protein kinase HipA